MLVSSALTGLAQVMVMNRDDTMAVDTSVGADGTFEKTASPERDVDDVDCDADCDDCDVRIDDLWSVLTADFERAIDSPSGGFSCTKKLKHKLNFMHYVN